MEVDGLEVGQGRIDLGENIARVRQACRGAAGQQGRHGKYACG
jgi:hypothetical protein